jgi:hypothetical protein
MGLQCPLQLVVPPAAFVSDVMEFAVATPLEALPKAGFDSGRVETAVPPEVWKTSRPAEVPLPKSSRSTTALQTASRVGEP